MNTPAARLLPQIVSELAEELGNTPLTIESPGTPNFVLVSEARYDHLVNCANRLHQIDGDEDTLSEEAARAFAAFEARDAAD